MTVSTINSVADFVTNGVTTIFPFYFKFLENKDLVVTFINSDGISFDLVMGTHYTVTGAGNENGGSIITTTALAGPGQLIVSRDMEAYQQTSLRNQGKFLAETHEDVFDKLTMLIQQGFAIFKRALTRPFGREYFFAENRRIANVKNPVEPQDAATKKSVEDFVASILETGQGPINNAANVVIAGANGYIGSVQDLTARGSSLKGAAMLGLESGGNLGQAVTHVTPSMFGARNNGIDDDYVAIFTAVVYASIKKVELWLSGSYATSQTLDFSNVRKIRCINDARVLPLFGTGVAVRWIAASGMLIEKPVQDGNLHVDWPTRDWTKDRTSFLLQNVYSGDFDFSSSKATRALLMKGLEKGCTYNNVRLGVMSNNLVGVWLSSGSANGWCNANNIIGGRYYGMDGTGVGNTVAGSLYESRAGHLYVETTPYANNGNKFTSPSLEWIGPGFKLARMGGLSNTLAPIYCELRDGDTTWITDTGTNNTFELMGVPSISGGYDPDLAPSENRVDVSGAIEPKVSGSNGYIDGNVRQVVRTRNGTRPAIVAINAGAGAALEGRNASSASNPSIVATGPSGGAGVSIPAAGVWTMFGGTKRVHWSMALAPTTGTWARGDHVYFTNPAAGGHIGAVCVESGTPGTWKNFGPISA